MRLRRLGQIGHSHLILPIAVMVIIGGIGAYILTRSHAATSCSTHAYRQSTAKNNCVKEIQTRLNSVRSTVGFGQALAVDGIFGPKTKAAVTAFQKHYKVGVTNGEVDTAKTWPALLQHTTTLSSSGVSSTSATDKSPSAYGLKVKTLVNTPGFTLQACTMGETTGSGSNLTYKMVGFVAHDPKSSSVITAIPGSPEIMKFSRGQYAYATGLDFVASHTYYYFPYGNLAAPDSRYGFTLGSLPKCN